MNKKLKLNKKTVSDLTRNELAQIRAGEAACWENLWTLYYCQVVYTYVPPPPTTAALPPEQI